MIMHVSSWEVCCGIAKHLSYWLPFASAYRKHHILAESPPPWVVESPGWYIEGVSNERTWRRSTLEVADAITKAAGEKSAKVIHLQYAPDFMPFDALRRVAGWCKDNDTFLVATMHVVMDVPEFLHQNKAILRWMDQVVVGTPAMKLEAERIARMHNITIRRPVRVIFLPVPPIPTRVVEKMTPGPVVLSWGMLGGVKGLLEVSRAVKMLRDYKYVDAVHKIVGKAFTGEQRSNLEELRRVADSSDGCVRVVDDFPNDAEIYRLCQESHAIVINHKSGYPSSSGSVSLSVASGTPTIVNRSTIYSGYSEMGAVLESDGTAGSIAGMIERVVEDPGILNRGRTMMLQNIMAPIVAAQYEDVYREVLR